MTSTSVTTVGGLVIITQVIPQDGPGLQLQTPAPQQATPPATQAPPTAPASKMDEMTTTFLRGEPRTLGIVQIFIGLLCVIFSVTPVFSPVLFLHTWLCLGVIFLVSGSLAVAAAKRTSVGQVWASLVFNLISVLLGLVGVAFLCWLLAQRPPAERLCDSEAFEGFKLSDEQETRCRGNLFLLNSVVYGLVGLLLVLMVLQVCVSVTVCVFSVRALRRRDCHDAFTVKVDDCSALLSGAASELGSDVSLLDSK